MVRTITLQRPSIIAILTALLLNVGSAEALSFSPSTKGMLWSLSAIGENISPNRSLTPASYDFKRLEQYKSSLLSNVYERWNQHNDSRIRAENRLDAPINLDKRYLSKIEDSYGLAARERIEQWQAMTSLNRTLPIERKLSLVNDFFNKMNFISDLDHWGKVDYWASPVEMLSTNGGDCEDYSIAKYFTLKAMGVSAEHLRITYVNAVKLKQAHMVLAYYEQPNKEPLILDNIIDEILPASKRTDLVPVYSFNGSSGR